MKRIFIIITVLVILISFAVYAGGSAQTKQETDKVPAEPAKPTLYAGSFLQIPGGSFTMGGGHLYGTVPRADPWPEVTVSTFYMAIFPVTQKEYLDLTGNNPSYGGGPDWQVEAVSWFDAIEYCNRLSERDGLVPAYTIDKNQTDPAFKSEDAAVKWLVTWNRSANGYRLPTEAEWEYAARAPTATWVSEHPWGLLQMPGEYWEWVWDWHDTLPTGTFTDPAGAASGIHRVLRGGPYAVCEPRNVACTMRDHDFPSAKGGFHFGFRLVRSSI